MQQQKLAVTLFGVALVSLVGIFGNKHIGNEQFAVFFNAVSVVDVGMAETQRFDLGTGQFQPGNINLVYLVVKIRPPVLGNQTGGNKIGF